MQSGKRRRPFRNFAGRNGWANRASHVLAASRILAGAAVRRFCWLAMPRLLIRSVRFLRCAARSMRLSLASIPRRPCCPGKYIGFIGQIHDQRKIRCTPMADVPASLGGACRTAQRERPLATGLQRSHQMAAADSVGFLCRRITTRTMKTRLAANTNNPKMVRVYGAPMRLATPPARSEPTGCTPMNMVA